MDVTSAFRTESVLLTAQCRQTRSCPAMAGRQKGLPMERTQTTPEWARFLMAGRWEFILRVRGGACLCNAGDGLVPGSQKSPWLYVHEGGTGK